MSILSSRIGDVVVGWLYAAWWGFVGAALLCGLMIYSPVAAAGFITGGLVLLFTLHYERTNPNDLPAKFSHAVVFVVAFSFAVWLVGNHHAEQERKIERYQDIVADWRAGLKRNAIEKLEADANGFKRLN